MEGTEGVDHVVRRCPAQVLDSVGVDQPQARYIGVAAARSLDLAEGSVDSVHLCTVGTSQVRGVPGRAAADVQDPQAPDVAENGVPRRVRGRAPGDLVHLGQGRTAPQVVCSVGVPGEARLMLDVQNVGSRDEFRGGVRSSAVRRDRRCVRRTSRGEDLGFRGAHPKVAVGITGLATAGEFGDDPEGPAGC